MTAASLAEQLLAYDAEFDLLQQFVIPEEDRPRFTSAPWDGGYRWFRSENVICLEKVPANSHQVGQTVDPGYPPGHGETCGRSRTRD